MEDNKDREKLYELLSQENVELPEKEQFFDDLINDPDCRKWAYQTLVDKGYDDIDEQKFYRAMSEQTVHGSGSVPTASSLVNNAHEASRNGQRVEVPSQGNGTPKAPTPQSSIPLWNNYTPAPMMGANRNAATAAANVGKPNVAPADTSRNNPVANMRQQHYNDSLPVSPAALSAQNARTEEQQKAFDERTRDFRKQMDANLGNLDAQQRRDAAMVGRTIEAAKNPFNTQKVVQMNPATGHFEEGYVTKAGNVVGTEEELAQENRAVDAAFDPEGIVSKELESAYAERDRLNEAYEERVAEISKSYTPNNSIFRSFDNGRGISYEGAYAEISKDPEARMLLTAKRKAEERIKILEKEKNQYGFMNVLWNTLTSLDTWDFGLSDLADARNMMQYGNKELSGKEKEARDAMMRNAYETQSATQEYGENDTFWQRAGELTANAIPFVVEFALTGGGFGAATEIGTRIGTKAVTNLGLEAAGRFTKNGVKKWVVRNSGVLAGDFVASIAMANTTGAANTWADILSRHNGEIVLDQDGNPVFSGGKSWGESIYEGEMASTLEYYTEKLGSHLEIEKGLEKLGLGKLSAALNRIKGSEWNKMLGKVGVNELPGEAIEEEANIILNSLLVGDNKFSDLFDPKTQADIWGGMMLSIGFMKSPAIVQGVAKPVVDRALYHRYEKAVNNAGSVASFRLTEERWEPIREKIDNTTNQDMKDVVWDILNDGNLNNIEKKAIMDYVENLMKLRGFNLRTMADAKDLAGNAADTDEDKAVRDQENSIADAYSEGYNADDEEGKEIMIAHAVDNTSERAKAAYDGLMQKIKDEIEHDFAVKSAALDAHTHEDGNVYTLAMKETDEDGTPKNAFLVKGNLVMWEDGNGVDHTKSDNVVYVFNPETNKIESIDPSADTGIDFVVSKNSRESVLDGYKQESESALQARIDELSNKVTVQPGQQTKTNDGTDAVVISVNGDDVLLKRADGKEENVSLSDMQRILDEALIADYEASHADDLLNNTIEQYAEEFVEGVPEKYEPGMRLTVKREDGSETEAEVMGVGRWDKNANGKFSFVPDENGSIVEYKADGEVAHLSIAAMPNFVTGYKEKAAPAATVAPAEVETTAEPVETAPEANAVESNQNSDNAIQEAYNGIVEKFGDKAAKQISVTVESKEKIFQKAETTLNRAKEAYDKTPIDKIEKAQKRLDNAQAKYNEAKADLEYWQKINAFSNANAESIHSDNAEGTVANVDEVGRIDKVNADAIVDDIKRYAEVAPDVELTPTNWIALFGESGEVDTPIGIVKMGENQYFKMARSGRDGKLGMVKPTLERPDFIIEDIDNNDEAHERNSSYVFIKGFIDKEGNRTYYFTSVSVKQDGKEVVISNQEKRGNTISKLLQKGKVVWKNEKFSLHPISQVEESVPLSETNKPTNTDTQSALLGINSPELSGGKGTEISETDKKNVANNSVSAAESDYEGALKKYGEKAAHKISTTVADREKVLGEKSAALAKAQQEYDDAPIGKEDKAEKKLEKARAEYDAAKAELDRWNEVKKLSDRAELESSNVDDLVKAEEDRIRAESEKRSTYVEKAGNAAEMVIRAKKTYGDYFDSDFGHAYDVNEVVSLGMPNAKLRWDSDANGAIGLDRATGLKRSDFQKFNSMIAKKGEGMPFNDFVHSIYESEANMDTDGNPRFQDDEIRDALIGMLMSYEKPNDIKYYHVYNRIKIAEDAISADDGRYLEAFRNEKQEEINAAKLYEMQRKEAAEWAQYRDLVAADFAEIPEEEYFGYNRAIIDDYLQEELENEAADSYLKELAENDIDNNKNIEENADRRTEETDASRRGQGDGRMDQRGNEEGESSDETRNQEENEQGDSSLERGARGAISGRAVEGEDGGVKQQKAGNVVRKATEEQKLVVDGIVGILTNAGMGVYADTEVGQRILDDAKGGVQMNAAESMRRKKREEELSVKAKAISLATGKPEKEVRKKLLEAEEQRRRDAKEVYDIILSGEYNDVSLQKINDFINNATPRSEYGRRVSERLPQRVERKMLEGKRGDEVEALFTRASESSIPANERTREATRGGIAEAKKSLLEKWAKASGHWHTELSDFTDETEPLDSGHDSDVYMSKDGTHVIKLSRGKNDKRFKSDPDAVTLFNYVFPNSAYRVLGYGDFGKGFVRILEQPYVDFANSTPLSVDERVEYMRNLGFKPINKECTAFSNGELLVADLQKSNIVRSNEGNIRVIDADVKLHTKDVGGNYTYLPVEHDLPNGDGLQQMKAWHGSAAVFDAFDSSHFLEGEGSMVYGAGHYVTDVEGTGRMYANVARGANRKVGRTPMERAVNSIMGQYVYNSQADSFEKAKEVAIRNAKSEIESNKGMLDGTVDVGTPIEGETKRFVEESLKNAEEELAVLNGLTEDVFLSEGEKSGLLRQLYEVEIPDDNGNNYIDWNANDSETLKSIADKLPYADIQKYGIDRGIIKSFEGLYNDVVKRSGSPTKASAIFADAGFVGIKVPTGNRSGGDGRGMNYVIFNDSDLKIQNRISFHKADNSSPVFYSNAYRAVEGIKQEKATPEQWLAMLQKNGGLKAGEVELDLPNESDRVMHSVDVTPEMKDSVMDGQPMFFKTEEGDVYGFTLDGKIYIDRDIATAETPIHEYTHLWAAALRKANPKAWAQLKKALTKEQDVMDYVKRKYPELAGNDDALMDEVFAHYSGRRGNERIEAEMKEEMAKADGVFDKAKVATIFGKIKAALNIFWNMARDLFAGSVKGLDKMKAEDFADMAMNDLLNGFNPMTNDGVDAAGQKTLMGVHNISEDKLRKAIKNGGFANPSVAVVDTRKGVHDSYGDISLIPTSSSMLEKRLGRNAGTWMADAWTPTYPAVNVLPGKGTDKVRKEIMQEWAANEPDEAIREELKKNLGYFVDGSNRGSERLQYQFLKEKGMQPEVYEKTNDYDKEFFSFLKNLSEETGVPITELCFSEHGEKVGEYYGKRQAETVFAKDKDKKVSDDIRQRITQDFVGKWKDNLGRLDGIVYDVYKRSTRPEKETDANKTFVEASFKVNTDSQLSKEYSQWLAALDERLGMEEKLFAGYTPSGNRSYVANTVENASKLMNKGGQAGNTGLSSVGAFIAKISEQANTLEKMRKNKDKLIGKDQGFLHDDARQHVMDEFFDLSQILNQGYDEFGSVGEARLNEIAGMKGDIRGYLKREYGVDVSDEWMQRYNDLVDYIRKNYPVFYFETKFNRPVALSEFGYAVVPEGTDEDVVHALQRAGVEVSFYNKDIEGDRERVVNEVADKNDGIKFHKADADDLSDEHVKSVVKEINDGKVVKAYRAMQLVDGKLYPPMAAVVEGEYVEPTEPGDLQIADERPDLVKNGKFKLNKGNGSSVDAAYNPYFHTSRSPLNDQFSSAWNRPNLVTVEVEIPESELTSGYKAEGAKDAVGETEWKSGPVSGVLAKEGNPRKVILSRYCKVNRVLDDREVAERIAEMLAGSKVEGIPFNTVSPSLRDALVDAGVDIVEPQKGNAGDAARGAYEDWKNNTNDSDKVRQEVEAFLKPDMFSIPEKIRRDMHEGANKEIDALGVEDMGDVERSERAIEKGLSGAFYTYYDGMNMLEHDNVPEVVRDAFAGAEYKHEDIPAELDRMRKEQQEEIESYSKEDIEQDELSRRYYIEAKENISEIEKGQAWYDENKGKLVMAPVEFFDDEGRYVGPSALNEVYYTNEIKGDSLQTRAGAETDELPRGTSLYNADAKGRGSDLSNATQNDPIRTRAELGAALKSTAKLRNNLGVAEKNLSEQKRDAVSNAGKQLNTKVNIVENVDDISGTNAERKRKAKGWFDINTGEITVVLPNCTSVEDAIATVGHETIGHKGMRELLGENYDAFLDEVYDHLNGEMKRRVDEKVNGRFLNDMKGGIDKKRRVAVDELFAEMAEKPFEEFTAEEQTFWQKLKATVRKWLDKLLGGGKLPTWFEIGDNEIRYMLWRSKENLERGREGIIEKARDIVKREELGIDGELFSQPARKSNAEREVNKLTKEDLAVLNHAAMRINSEAMARGEEIQDELRIFTANHYVVVKNNELGNISPIRAYNIEKSASEIWDDIRRNVRYEGNQISDSSRRILDEARSRLKGGLLDTGDTGRRGTGNGDAGVGGRQQSYRDSDNTLDSGAHLDGDIYSNNFKRWFGDWENDPENASKVVDENGRPMVMYHGSGTKVADFDVFIMNNGSMGSGAYFSSSYEEAADYAKSALAGKKGFPEDVDDISDEDVEEYVGEYYLNVRDSKQITHSRFDRNAIEVVARNPRDIKSATDNNGDFDPDNDGLRFRDDEYAELDDIWKDGSVGLMARRTAAMAKLAEINAANKVSLNNAIAAIGGNLSQLEEAAIARQAYDRSTANEVADLARVLIQYGWINPSSKGEMKRIILLVKNSVGKDDISGEVDKLLTMMINDQLKDASDRLDSLMKIKGGKVNAKGIEVMGKLDPKGQAIMKYFKDAIGKASGSYMMTVEEIQYRISELNDIVTDTKDEVKRDNASLELTAMKFALDYVHNVVEKQYEYADIRRELKDAKDAIDTDKEYIANLEDALVRNRVELLEAYNTLVGSLSGSMQESMANAQSWKDAEVERVKEIHHNANSDLEGKPYEQHRKDGFADKMINFQQSLITAPLGTFEQMFRMFGAKNASGEGYLYNRYVRGFVDARNKEITGYRSKINVLDKKVKELFGVKTLEKLIEDLGKMPSMNVKFMDGGEMKDHEMNQGQLMYIYMVNKMLDGRMKLRKMGIDNAAVGEITEALNPKIREFADWIQSEFLVDSRNEYNETHKRLFGAPMAEVEDYFPLKINSNSRGKTEDEVNGAVNGVNMGVSTSTGAIVKRRRNSIALDLMNANALEVLVDHVNQMEHWNAFAEFNRDLNTLRTYNRFENKVKNMKTIYGTGEHLWKHFNDLCQVATGDFDKHHQSVEFDKAVTNIAKGFTAAKISFRSFTALKQITSMPAFLADARTDYLIESLATPWNSWKWCMDNLPIFEERWKSRFAGDPRMAKTDVDWAIWRNGVANKAARIGMLPNAAVDAFTIAVGTYAVYKSKRDRYKKMGYSDAEADKRAKQDAAIIFNLSQQSSEGAFVSRMQVD